MIYYGYFHINGKRIRRKLTDSADAVKMMFKRLESHSMYANWTQADTLMQYLDGLIKTPPNLTNRAGNPEDNA